MRSHAKAPSAGSTRRRGGAPSARGFAVALLGALCLLGLSAAPASALLTHPYLFSFPDGSASDGIGVAVDQSNGVVYVADLQAGVVRKFDSSGSPSNFSALGTNVLGGLSEPRRIAVDPSSSEIYVTTDLTSIRRFDAAGNPSNFTAGSGAGTNLLTGSETPTGHFGQSLSLAVFAGHLYVSQNVSPAVISKYSTSGAYSGFEISSPALKFPGAIALDSTGAIFAAENNTEEVVKFDSAGTPLTTFGIGGGMDIGFLAIEPATNTVFVTYVKPFASEGSFARFSSTGVAEGVFGADWLQEPGGIAVNSTTVPDSADGRIFLLEGERNAVDVFGPRAIVPDVTAEDAASTLAEVTFTGTVNTAGTAPEGALTDCHFEYVTKEAFEADLGDGFFDLSSGGTAPCTSSDGNPISGPGEIPNDGGNHTVTGSVTGLPQSSEYVFRLVAASSRGPNRSEGVQFATVGPPTVSALFAREVATTTATLLADANPNDLSTTYRFEYVDDATYQADVSSAGPGHGFDHALLAEEGDLGSGQEDVRVSASLSGLSPATTYHYRLVVENDVTSVASTERTIVTQPSVLGFELPDERAWEMVSPPNKQGARLEGVLNAHIQAAEDGNGLVYGSKNSIEADPDGNRAVEPSSVLAHRSGTGWSSKDITPPNDRVVALSLAQFTEYKIFTPDLSKAVIEPRDGTTLSPLATERTPYLRENTDSPTYTPLVTGKEGFANVPPGTVFGGGGKTIMDVRPTGATPDLSHVVLKSPVSLAAGAPSGEFSQYLWSDGELQPIGALPAGEGGAIVKSLFGSGDASVRNAISDDGSRVFWTRFDSPTHLYVSEMEAGETARIDVVQPGASGAGAVKPAFQGASADGSVVYFTDTHQLTVDASPSGRDLYRCELPPPDAPLTGCTDLTNLSAPLPGSGESADVQGLLLGLTDDGSRLYFVAKGVLDTGTNSEGESAVEGEPNLYLWQQGEGLRFLATLSIEDTSNWGMPDIVDPFGLAMRQSAASSPNGRFLALMSERPLVGSANVDPASGEAVQRVFRYDALQDRLDCVSCDPTGAAPTGGSKGDKALVNPRGQWGANVAAALPQSAALEEGGPVVYRPRAIFDNGRVFFNAIDSLVPADSNGQWDVYQHEPTGVGDCSPSSGGASIARSAGGCLSLISSGTGEEEAAFLDASASGDDVFFLTPARLSVLDEDSELDVYDARVNGVPATRPPNTECLGEACQPAVIAPSDPTPASIGFKGQGNPKPQARKRCAKNKRLVRRGGKARCVVRKQARKGKASKGRRASR